MRTRTALRGAIVTWMSTNPTFSSICFRSSSGVAPEMQPASAAACVCKLGRNRRDRDDVTDRETAARPEHAQRFAEHGRLLEVTFRVSEQIDWPAGIAPQQPGAQPTFFVETLA